ncbi:MAG: hypothetical protein AUF79_01585 [Crenarchaeota archaeon 13_1_20CM_2_51_8]|nr:MAG: hypothetical protein AUF79_01585 [Crenarchaeota archaeon 13_1_20CM_2_51_8]
MAELSGSKDAPASRETVRLRHLKDQSSSYRKPFFQRLVHNYVHSNVTLIVKLGDLRVKFRPLSYDPIVIFSVLIRHIYGKIPANSVVVDVGAHIGTFSLHASLARSSTVLAFEPEPKNFELLRENLAINGLSGKVHAFKQAVWSRDEKRILFTSKGSAFHSFYPEKNGIGGTEPTDCVDINTILDPLNYPVLLKIDAEGSEYEIIPHINSINIGKISRIELEYHLGDPSRRIAFHSLLKWFSQKGFDVYLRHDVNVLSAFKKQQPQ